MNDALATLEGAIRPASRDQNAVRAYVETLQTPMSKRTMINTAREIMHLATPDRVVTEEEIDSFPWGSLRQQHVAAIISRLLERGKAPATVNRYRAALRGIAYQARALKQMDEEEYQSILRVKPARGSRPAAGRTVSEVELSQMASSLGDATIDVRDNAILAVLHVTAIRRSELVGLDIKDYEPPQNRLRVRGKGNKVRYAYLGEATAPLVAWIAVRGPLPGALFLHVNNGQLLPKRLGASAIGRMLDRRCMRTGTAHFSPHDMRRTAATTLRRKKVDIRTIQQHLGHADISTTATYIRNDDEQVEAAVKEITTPFAR